MELVLVGPNLYHAWFTHQCRSEEIREVTPTRYLVPESVYDGPGWTRWLRPVVTRLVS